MVQNSKKGWRKGIALLCALMLVITMLPVPAHAAAKPKFSKVYKSLYENADSKGVYTYTVKNLTKGQTVKWSVTGTGKSYAKLKKTSTKASGTSVSNTVTIKTGGKTAAKNKVVNVTAKVYSKAGKLQYTLSAGNAKIKIKATKVSIESDALSEKKLYIGESYQFKYKLTPANATSSNKWSVTSSTGADVSTYITQGGVFTPKAEGTYTITITAKTGSSSQTDSKTVVVGPTMTEAKQVAANQVAAVFSSNARSLVDQKSFTLEKASGAKVDIKSIAFSDDGKEVILTTYANLEDSVGYTLTDGIMEYSFTAKIGRPVTMKVLTTKVTVNKETPIEYGIYDANGIEVSTAYPGTIKYDDFKITNGYVTEADNKLIMTNVGDTGTFWMTYICASDPTLTLTAYGEVTCVIANLANDTNFTLTTSETAPDYTASNYSDTRRVAAGSNYYIHFRALDSDKTVLQYDSITYESSDPDTLLVNNRGGGVAQATAIKSGTVRIVVTAYYGKQNYVYTFEVTVAEPSYLTRLTLDRNSVQISSNRASDDYSEYINITAVDQYGQEFILEDETAQIVDNSSIKLGLATYDAAANRIVVKSSYNPGTYYYTLTLTSGGKTMSANFVVVIQSPPENGSVSYRVDVDAPITDLAITKDTDLDNPKQVVIRMAEYRGGIFYNYMPIDSATVVKNGLYYQYDLTKDPSSKEVTLSASQSLPLNVFGIDGSVFTKAETGVYTVNVRFYTTQGKLATASTTFELKDSQVRPDVTVAHSTATVSCNSALALAQNCLNLSGADNAMITDCVVTGSTKAGSDYAINTGDSVNIKSVTVQVSTVASGGKTIISRYTVAVGKTLKNL